MCEKFRSALDEEILSLFILTGVSKMISWRGSVAFTILAIEAQ